MEEGSKDMNVWALALDCAFLPRSVCEMVVHLSKCNLSKKISTYIVVLFTFVNNTFCQLLYKSHNNNV